ncbi:MAG: hypothetical protein ACM3VW_10205 [Bacteroidota bacterium]
MPQPCDCAAIKRTRRISIGITGVTIGLILLIVGGWHVADFFLRPQLIGEPHNALGHWVARTFHASSPTLKSETQQLLGQILEPAMAGVGYYVVIFGFVSIGWALFQSGCQLLWRGLRKEPQPCPHCGSTP